MRELISIGENYLHLVSVIIAIVSIFTDFGGSQESKHV